MKIIRFGDKETNAEWITNTLDRGKYACSFGSMSADTDFSAYDAVIPFQVYEYDALRGRKPDQRRRWLIPSLDVVALCDDKLALNRHLLASRFRDLIPEVYEPGTAPSYPYILKPRLGEDGRGCVAVTGPADERKHAALLNDPGFFRQRLVTGDVEYAFHLLFARGRVSYHLTVVYQMPAKIYVKSGTYKPLDHSLHEASPHLDIFAELMLELGYEGICCINYKFEEGRLQLMEVNPRFGHTLCHDINRFLAAYLAILQG